ncbi:Asp-tRNA(Asn)/Glu-tRNA(Gln) amidotransferase subunit GatA [bacterium]|nr:Asp-tRNA(Asn)/Glu-tRNA(Gln) amidotransferase subunit GatA [bacterium]NBX71635.1 Asp-tRNA(Asn)/Glu-tRNA(Gln) amidotransferase subunit GatA [bacterium]
MTAWHQKTLTQLSNHLHQGDISSTALTEHFLNRMQEFNPSLNCYLAITADLALQQAQSADRRLKEKTATLLTGIPYAHKDIFCTQGIKTTCGSKMLENFVAPYDATVTKKLHEQGLVMLGKTNMDEFAMGSTNEHSYFGPCKNPFDLQRAPGGSSGGSASAVAAGLAVFSTGSDTGGSIRQPASFCHLVGIKPTYGRVSRYGMIAFASSLDQGGVLSQSVADAALVLEAMSGHDPLDSTSAHQPVPQYFNLLNNAPNSFKVAVPRSFFEAMDPSSQEAFKKVLEHIRSIGGEVDFIDFNIQDIVIPTYYIIAPAEASSNLARYDGVRYGYQTPHAKNLEDLYMKTRGEGFGAEVKRRILMGTYVLSSGYYDAFYQKALKVRALINSGFQEIFKKYHVIATPTALSEASLLKSHDHDPLAMYYSDLCTVSVNLANLPAISLPLMQRHGLPLGFQLIGNHFDELTLLQISHKLEQVSPWVDHLSPIKARS